MVTLNLPVTFHKNRVYFTRRGHPLWYIIVTCDADTQYSAVILAVNTGRTSVLQEPTGLIVAESLAEIWNRLVLLLLRIPIPALHQSILPQPVL